MKQGGTITCVSYRNYITTWSDFNLLGNTQIRANFGFRVYPTSTSINPIAKGYAENVMLMIQDSASGLAMNVMTSLALANFFF